MTSDFFAKHAEGAKFHIFCNIIMNISHDEFGPVDVNKLMTIHNEKMVNRFNMVLEWSIADNCKMNAHIISKEQYPDEVNS